MKKSIQIKLVCLVLLSLLVAVSLSLLLHFVFFRPFYLNHTENRLLGVFEEIEAHLYEENFHEILKELDYKHQAGIIIIDKNFEATLFYQNLTSSTEEGVFKDLKNLIEKSKDTLEYSHIFQQLEGDGELHRQIFIKKLPDDSYCVLSSPLEVFESSMDAMDEFHLMAGSIACISGVIMTIFCAKQFTKPIISISKATDSLSRLDFQQKINYESQDELGQLASSINLLSEKLEKHKNALKDEVDFQKILCQNISHELKTPISVINGYLEAIFYGAIQDEQKKTEYIKVAINECGRMTNLIDSMLHLSNLSSFQEKGLEKQLFSSQEFEKQIRSHCDSILQKNNIVLEGEFQPLGIWGNEELLLQAFGNFVSNAVKYGDGNEIRMSLEKDNQWIYLCLFNSGNAVPVAEQERIFDFFYMIDKVRSRESSSHGLGLSLCKTVAKLHQGETFCESISGGMKFTLQVPRESEVTLS